MPFLPPNEQRQSTEGKQMQNIKQGLFDIWPVKWTSAGLTTLLLAHSLGQMSSFTLLLLPAYTTAYTAGWLEFNVSFQQKYGYIRDETAYTN